MHNQCSGICPGPVHFANSEVARACSYPWASKPAVRTWAQDFPSMKQNMMGGTDKLRAVVPYAWFRRSKIFVFFLDVKPIPMWHIHGMLIPMACSFPLIGKLKPKLFLELHVWPWPKKQKAESTFTGGGSQLPFCFGFPDESLSSWCRGEFLDGHTSVSAPV